jgi:hypothetical protein
MTHEADEIGIPVEPTSQPWGDPARPGGAGAALLIRDRKQLFLDDGFLVETATRVRRVMHQPVKHAGNPVMRADESWERGSGINGGTILHDEGQWRMWHLPSLATVHGSTAPVAYATPDDGIHWQKPDLGLVAFESSKKNNLIMESALAHRWHSHGGKVLKDPPQAQSDPNRRYKMLLTVIRQTTPRWGFMVAFSPDGIHWTVEPEPIVVDYRKHYGAFNTAFYDDMIHIYYAGWGRDGVAEGMDAIEPGTKSSLAAGAPGTRPRSVGLARLRLDGFISLDAGVLPGRVTTWPVVFEGSRLELNVDARRIVRSESVDHGVRVEITDPLGHVVPGYGFEDCDPIREDNVRHRVTRRGRDDVGALAGRPVRLRFHLCYARLYAFQFSHDGH